MKVTTNVIRFSNGLYEGIGGAVEDVNAAFRWEDWDAGRNQLDIYRQYDKECKLTKAEVELNPQDEKGIWLSLSAFKWLTPLDLLCELDKV